VKSEKMAKEANVLHEKSLRFAVRMVKFYQYLCEEKKEYMLSRQVLRSGTSIGANIAESRYAQSDPDFVSKLSIALKEANETCYWLNCLGRRNIIDQQGHQSMLNDATELVKILISAIKTKKKNMAKGDDNNEG
jgi:four helix bundle protein